MIAKEELKGWEFLEELIGQSLTPEEKVYHEAHDLLARRKDDYVATFMTMAGQRVMKDLMRFCRATETCFDPDPRIHAALEGRREVILRVINHINLEPDQLLDIYAGKTAYVRPT